MTHRFRSHAAVLMALLPTALLLLAGCAGGSKQPPATVDPLAPFKKRATGAPCADTRSRLFVIDGQLVFWDRAGEFSDAAYRKSLFGRSPVQFLCVFHDSIAGPVKNCPDERYQELFDTVVANLDKPDLGLGPEHTVRQVPP
jgi:hypothetical protein